MSNQKGSKKGAVRQFLMMARSYVFGGGSPTGGRGRRGGPRGSRLAKRIWESVSLKKVAVIGALIFLIPFAFGFVFAAVIDLLWWAASWLMTIAFVCLCLRLVANMVLPALDEEEEEKDPLEEGEPFDVGDPINYRDSAGFSDGNDQSRKETIIGGEARARPSWSNKD